jgi:hypothetical protein
MDIGMLYRNGVPVAVRKNRLEQYILLVVLPHVLYVSPDKKFRSLLQIVPFIVTFTELPGLIRCTTTDDGPATGTKGAGAFVGNFVGALVGAFVGALVGLVVGALVGFFVGVLVGLFVGAGVGLFVGDCVGAFVGTAVGDFVGDGVGAFVGTVVGDIVGAFVGTVVGDIVGAFVGTAVGDFVGDGVGAFEGDFVGVLVGDGVGTGTSTGPIAAERISIPEIMGKFLVAFKLILTNPSVIRKDVDTGTANALLKPPVR